MAVKTLVLGFGGTGTHILTYLKELSIYKYGKKPDHFAFIEMDTIARKLWRPGETVSIGGATGSRETIAVGLGQEKIGLDPATEYLALEEARPPLRSLADKEMSSNGNRAAYPHLKDWLHTDWLKRIVPGAALNVESGAAQQRQIGRFAMVGNEMPITNAITKAFSDLQRAVPGGVVRVWLVCSSAGGTGAGCIIDGAAMVRMVAKQHDLEPTVTAIIALPEVYAGTSGVSRARAFSLFRELERFQGLDLVNPNDEISTGDRAQPGAWSTFNYDKDGRRRAIVTNRLFDYLFYLGENCPDLPTRISFFNSVSTAVDTFLDDNVGPGMMEELVNKDGHPMTFGGGRVTIPLNTYSELFAWEQAIEYLRAIGAPAEQSDGLVSGVRSGSENDRHEAAHKRVDTLLPLFEDLRKLTDRDRKQLPQYADRELEPRMIVKKWYQFAEPALSGVDVTSDQLSNDVPLTYCNPFVYLGDDDQAVKAEHVEIKTYSERSEARSGKESQPESMDRFARDLSDRLTQYQSATGGTRSFSRGRKLVDDSITRVLLARIDSRLAGEIAGFQTIAADPTAPGEGTALTRLFAELSYLCGDSGPLYKIVEVLNAFSAHLDSIVVTKHQEAINAIRLLNETQPPPFSRFRNWADGPQIGARDTSMDYIAVYQKQQLIHDMKGIVTKVRDRFTEWQIAIRNALSATVMDRSGHAPALGRIQRQHRDRLVDRLQRLASDERALISLAPRRRRGENDIEMNGYAGTLRQRSTQIDGVSLAANLASRTRWVATAEKNQPPRVAISIRSDDMQREIETIDPDRIDTALRTRFGASIGPRLIDVDIFDYLLYERDFKQLAEQAVAERLNAAATLLLDAGPDGSARWIFKAPARSDKNSYAQALEFSLQQIRQGFEVKSAMDGYSDRLSLTLLREARREHGQIRDISACLNEYLRMETVPLGTSDDPELARALVYHPFRGEAEAWLIERTNSKIASQQRMRAEDLIPPRVTRLLDHPDYFQAFVSCLATGTIKHDPDSDHWRWKTPDRNTPVDLGDDDLMRAAVVFCLSHREDGSNSLFPINVASAIKSARLAAGARAGVEGGSNKALNDEIRAFLEPAALETYLDRDKHLPRPPGADTHEQAVYDRLKSGLKMAMQFYGDSRTSTDLPDRRI